MNPTLGAGGFAAVLIGEAEAFARMWLGPGALELVGGLLGIALVQAILRGLVVRWGRAPGRRDVANLLRLLVRGLAWLIAVAFVLQIFARAAPVMTTGGALLVFFGLAFGLGLRARGWLLGWALLFGGRLRVGDQLQIGPVRGVVERLGLLRMRLRADDGALVIFPTSEITQAALTVSTPEQTVPVEVRIRLSGLVDAEALARARRAAGLCPYRSRLAEVSVVADGDDAVRVRLQTWSARAAERAEAYLRDALG